MAYFRTCPYCEANLDPGEVCECRGNTESEQRKERKVFTWAEIKQLIDRQYLERRYRQKKGA